MYACQYFSILFSLPSISHFVLCCFSAFHHLQLHLLAHDCNMTCSKFKTGAKLFLFFWVSLDFSSLFSWQRHQWKSWPCGACMAFVAFFFCPLWTNLPKCLTVSWWQIYFLHLCFIYACMYVYGALKKSNWYLLRRSLVSLRKHQIAHRFSC